MVARITFPDSLKDTLNYNEQKVQKGVAHCIGAGNFLMDAYDMNFYQKLFVFESRNSLNERATSKMIHISLNFDPSENLTREKLNTIAAEYLETIGFGEQPYLVYQHTDAGHPHIHIVSSTIRENGARINTHNIGRNQSERARKAIEAKYNLIRATREQHEQQNQLAAFDISRIEYGKTETRRGIANVLTQVLKSHNYTSLPELNAVLKQFGIIADRGEEGGFIHRNRGLLYKVLDAQGNKIGVPIKASALPGKPTLGLLETRFVHNKLHRAVPKEALKTIIMQTLATEPTTLQQFIEVLKQRQVMTVLRQNEEGRIYGITFIDQKNRSVFNGSELGKSFSISGIYKQLGTTQRSDSHLHIQEHPNHQHLELDLFEQLIIPIEDHSLTPFHLRKKKRKKKK